VLGYNCMRFLLTWAFRKNANKNEAKIVPTPTDKIMNVILKELLNDRLVGSGVLRPVSSSLVITRRVIWANDKDLLQCKSLKVGDCSLCRYITPALIFRN